MLFGYSSPWITPCIITSKYTNYHTFCWCSFNSKSQRHNIKNSRKSNECVKICIFHYCNWWLRVQGMVWILYALKMEKIKGKFTYNIYADAVVLLLLCTIELICLGDVINIIIYSSSDSFGFVFGVKDSSKSTNSSKQSRKNK